MVCLWGGGIFPDLLQGKENGLLQVLSMEITIFLKKINGVVKGRN